MHIGESEISSLKAKGQTLVVQPKEMKDRGIDGANLVEKARTAIAKQQNLH